MSLVVAGPVRSGSTEANPLNQKVSSWAVLAHFPARKKPDRIEICNGARQHQGVDAVEDSAMAWDDGAGVLDPEGPFQNGLPEIACLPQNARHDRERNAVRQGQARQKPEMRHHRADDAA